LKQGKDLKKDWDMFIGEGSSTSFYDLYAHYHDYLIFIGLKKGVSIEKTKDCINDLFLYVYENRERLVHIQNHHNYLITSFVHKLFRKQRFSATESLDLINLQDDLTYPSVEAQHISQHTSKQVTHVLKTYIDKLPSSQAKMIYQKFYLGLSYEEISETNDIAIKTAYNTIYNAVENLKKMMGDDKFGAFFAAISAILIFFLFLLKNHG